MVFLSNLEDFSLSGVENKKSRKALILRDLTMILQPFVNDLMRRERDMNTNTQILYYQGDNCI